ncbi:MAG: M28 family peptidase [Burkholderiales bacterium]
MRLSFALVFAALGLMLVLAVIYWLVTQPLVGVRRTAPPAADMAKLEAHVRALSERFHPRSFDRPDHLQQAASYIESEFRKAHGRVVDQFFEVHGVQYRNVIARYGPEQGALLVIGAHYDAVADTPGADDNASGVAGLLELARLLGENAPSISVELVAYCLEEPPYFRTESMGSARHARELRKSGREVRLMLGLEMIGYFSTAPDSQTYPLRQLSAIYPNRGDFIAVVGRVEDWAATRRVKSVMRGATDLPVQSINGPPAIPGIDFSDHSNYWDEGFSALMITDTAFYRNPYYHAAGDTADRLDYVSMAKVVQGIYAVAQSE